MGRSERDYDLDRALVDRGHIWLCGLAACKF